MGGAVSGMFTGKFNEYSNGGDGDCPKGEMGQILVLTKEREELYRKSARRICEIALMEREERERFTIRNILMRGL